MKVGIRSLNNVDISLAAPLNHSEAPTIVTTELVAFENRKGKRIVGFHDFPRGVSSDGAWIIVLPGYGETKSEVLPQSYFLAKNGFHTLRIDFSNHVGESDGEMLHTTLENMKDDISSSLDYLYRRYCPRKVGAVANSLASRALLRAGREDNRLRLLLNLVAVVDLQQTLFAIYEEDFLEQVKRGSRVGLMDVLGFQVDADLFLSSAIENRYDDLKTTIDDVKHIEAPTIFFVAENDVWVDFNDVRLAAYAAPGRRRDLQIIDGAMHELQESPRVTQGVLEKIVDYATLWDPRRSNFDSIKEPNLTEIGFRIRQERRRKRILHASDRQHDQEFWKSYLSQYSFVVNVPDYWDLMNLVHKLLGKANPHDKILDAGCGIGNYAMFILVKLLYAAKQQPVWPVECQSLFYVGLDFVKEAIAKGKKTQDELQKQFTLTDASAIEGNLLVGSYCLADLECGLPFRSNVFDKICCNLVISYLRRPAKSVSEMVRVLKPDGKIVVSSLKPFADLSQVYRNFVQLAKGKADLEDARKLLSNTGRIKLREAEGLYEFFSEEALMDLLRHAGVCDIESYRSLGNQANVAVGRKPSIY